MTDETTTDQASEQSVTDRIAGKFGFPGAAAEAEAAAAGAETGTETVVDDGFADIEWEGVKARVPSKLKDAFMRNEDYTRKTQELAEQRRGVDQIRDVVSQRQLEAVFSESIQAESQEMSVIDAYLSQASKLDWSQMSTDQMLRHKVEVDNIKERRDALKAAVDGKRSKFNTDVKAKIDELRGKSREIAAKSIQGFGEDTEKSMRAFAQAEGLTDPEIDSVLLDPRSFKMIWKAMQFDSVQKGTGKAAEAATKAARVLRPGAANDRMPTDKAADLNFRKAMKAAPTSSLKARVIEDRLSGIFSKGHTQ